MNNLIKKQLVWVNNTWVLDYVCTRPKLYGVLLYGPLYSTRQAERILGPKRDGRYIQGPVMQTAYAAE